MKNTLMMDPRAPKIVRMYELALKRAASRYAADVLPFTPKTSTPKITIHGTKYSLSTDGGPLGDRADDHDQDDYGGRLIGPDPTANKWRYLWVYDTEKQVVAMWRVSDGNEKVRMRASTAGMQIASLEKKGQLNRVAHNEFRAIETDMDRREVQLLEDMASAIEENKSRAEKQLDGLLQKYFKVNVLPKLESMLAAVAKGVTPIGFKPSGPALDGDEAWLLRQKSSHVLGLVLKRDMNEGKVIEWLTSQGFDTSLVHNQSIEWAIGDIADMAAEKYLPPGP
jgi:hypothetical protein